MPYLTIKTCFETPDGQEEVMSEYLCDWPDCGNIAVHVIGYVREINAAVAVCDEHAAALKTQSRQLRGR